MKLQSSCVPHPDHGVAPCAAEVFPAQLQRVHGAAVGVCSAAGCVWDPPLGQAAQGEDLPIAGCLQRVVAGQEGFDGCVLEGSSIVSTWLNNPSAPSTAFAVSKALSGSVGMLQVELWVRLLKRHPQVH